MTLPTDFLAAPFAEPVTLPEDKTIGPGRYFNRELSWLAFNWRVLEEAGNLRVPLLERLRFVSISATNLDEFYTVRVAGLRELAKSGKTTPAADGRTPAEQIALISENAHELVRAQNASFNQIRCEMEAEGIAICSRDKLTKSDFDYLEGAFLDRVFPVLSPLAIDPAHPFPFVPNLGLVLALQLERVSDGRPLQALLPIPGADRTFHAAARFREHARPLSAA